MTVKRSRISSSAPPMRINVIPIIDVSLVLVVILLVTAPVLAVSDLPITLPEAETKGAEDELRVTITIGNHGEMAVDEDEVTPANFRAAVGKRIAETRPDVLVAVRADAGLPYAQVEAILNEARLAGAKRIAIATRQGDRVLDEAVAGAQARPGGEQ
jgi:biopolymer transport protein TolR